MDLHKRKELKDSGTNEAKNADDVSVGDNHRGKKLVFREKQFQTRPSLLTVLMEKEDVRAVRSLVIASVFLMYLGTMISDTTAFRNPFMHLWLVFWNFRYFSQTMFVWALMTLSTVLPYFVLKIWSGIPSKQVTLKSGMPLIGLFIVYLSALFCFPLLFLFRWKLNCACSFIITCENTRIAMKMHSFIREVTPRAIRMKLAANDDQNNNGSLETFPSLKQLAYFLFCPSFIYRDEYPRTATRDWSAVLMHFMEVLLTILCVNLIFTQMIYPRFHSVDYTKTTIGFVVNAIFPMILPGLLCLLLLFYGLLHCWLNMFSEIMYFADRQFYADWWNSKNMAEYYRNWNLVVHDWLYAYVYRDISVLVGGKKGLKVSQTAVFFLSAAFHEYWFGTALRIFYPIMFVLYFIFGGVFYWVSTFIRSAQAWNVAMFTNLLIGTGMFISFYAQEWYARHRCVPVSDNAFVELFIPRHWFCSEYIDNVQF